MVPGPSRLGAMITGRAPAGARPVLVSDDLLRVAALPRRPQPEGSPALVASQTALYRIPTGTMTLRPVQAAALAEIATVGGLVGLIGVGEGKTLISALAGEAVGAARPLLLVPASLEAKTQRDLRELRQHWRVPAALKVCTYEAVSGTNSSAIFARLNPDLIIADEAHCLKNREAARTKRFLRWFSEHPETRLVAMSGTLTSHGIADFATLALLALDVGAPVPVAPAELRAWGEALDDGVPPAERRSAGALAEHLGLLPGETAREGFRRRLVETPGVIATTVSSLGTGLEIALWKPAMPGIAAMLAATQSTGLDPDGNDLSDPVDIARVCKCLALGFWYRWAWPGGEPDLPWLEARNGWARATRWFLGEGATEGLDSPALLARACERGEAPTPALARAWAAWAPERHKPEPPVVPAWASAEALDQIVAWAKAHPKGLVWTEHRAVLEALAPRLPGAVYPAGTTPPPAPRKTALVLSRPGHGTGKNLQAWCENLIVGVPSSGEAWEQLLGRTHRPGQQADTVNCLVLANHPVLERALHAARDAAEYISQTTGNPQKLNLASWL